MIVKNVAGSPIELKTADIDNPLALSNRSWLVGRNCIFITNSKINQEEIFAILAMFPAFDYREESTADRSSLDDILKNSGFYQLSEGNQLATALYIVTESCRREAVQEQQRNLRYLMGIMDSDLEDDEEEVNG